MTTTRRRPDGAGSRRASRTVIAGGSAMVLGGISLAMGSSAPAEADHQEGLPPLNTTTWRPCLVGTHPQAPGAASWTTALWNNHPELDVAQSCDSSVNNITMWADAFPFTWFGAAGCQVALDPNGDCPHFFVGMNTTTIDSTPNPSVQWKKTACHEFGHVGGLAHRFDDNSCMTQGFAPPIVTIPDQHDYDAVSATYPRGGLDSGRASSANEPATLHVDDPFGHADMAELSQASDAVVRGTVVDADEGRRLGRSRLRATVLTVEVDEALAGHPDEPVEVLVESQIAGRPIAVEGRPTARVGDEGVWFLTDTAPRFRHDGYVLTGPSGLLLFDGDEVVGGGTSESPVAAQVARLDSPEAVVDHVRSVTD